MEPIINNTKVEGDLSITLPKSPKTHYNVEVFRQVNKYKLNPDGTYYLQDNKPVIEDNDIFGYEVIEETDDSLLLKRILELKVKRLTTPAVRVEAFNLLAGVFQYVFAVQDEKAREFIIQNMTSMSSILGKLLSLASVGSLRSDEYMSLSGALAFLNDFVIVEKTLIKELEIFLAQSQQKI